MEPDRPLLSACHLHVAFPLRTGGRGWGRTGWHPAVQGVNLAIRRGETLALVGESGSGKTTVGRAILGRVAPVRGTVRFDGHDLAAASPSRRRELLRGMQMIFQDASSSLNPRLTIGECVVEPLVIQGHRRARGRAAIWEVAAKLLADVGISRDRAACYPHELSGGQRQRVAIARALAAEPRFVVCDEPVSALDPSIRSQIMNLLADLQSRRGLTYLLIAHDLALVRQAADQVAVMYRGRIVESGPASSVFEQPVHPYTQALRDASLAPVSPVRPASRTGRLENGGADAGCAYAPRCPLALEICRREIPALNARAGLPADHAVACHRAEESALQDVAGRTSIVPS